jgi:thymidylate synthase (FAD)
MKVTLVASTELRAFPNDLLVTPFITDQRPAVHPQEQADRLAQFAGRSCYAAWQMPNSKTANDEGYLANIIKQGHESILEHASASFFIEHVSRYLTHELVRHRHLSYSQSSMRYIDYSSTEPVIPPALREDPYIVGILKDHYRKALTDYNLAYHELIGKGLKKKQAREAARAFLPGCAPTSIVVTGNHRAWRDMLKKRFHVAADAEIRELATELLRQLRDIAPGCYQDLPTEPYGSE